MLSLNEVGVPAEIVMKLTVPERVTEWNIEYLKKFIERGPEKYPGSNYVIRPDGRRKKITEKRIGKANISALLAVLVTSFTNIILGS